jgi:hypothetical protein
MDDQRAKRAIAMNVARQESLVAILNRINEQVKSLDTMLRNPLSEVERGRISDELAYLAIERTKAVDAIKKLH